MEITIDKGIQIWSTGSEKWSAAEGAMRKMDVGDSFLFSLKTAPSPLYGAARHAGIKVSIRKVAEDQYRIWRTA